MFVLGVAVFILSSRNTGTTAGTPALNLIAEEEVADPLDTLSGADIALNVALMSGIDEASAVVHNIDAESVKKSVVHSGAQSIAKPTILRTDLKSKNDIVTHTAKDGDTVESIAIAYGVSSNSVRWSNDNLSNYDLDVGDKVVVPPVDGIVYKVADGDTPKSLASRYRSDEKRIIAFNDAEIDGLTEGENIVIPDGEIVPVYRAPASTATVASYSYNAAYGGNLYAPGNCTWHTANRRAAIGKPLPSNLGNAATWYPRAAAAGMAVGRTPQKHAAVQTGWTGWGHVGFVEEVYEDGSMLMSEMNYNWVLYATRSKVVPAEVANTYWYIY